MKNYEIRISGSGTQNQLAIRLLEIGRMLQLATHENEFINSSIEDGCLLTEITD